MKLQTRSIAVVTVVASSLLAYAVRILADDASGAGPCVGLQGDETHSSIECRGGSCTGFLLNVHGESRCAGQEGGGDCETQGGPKYTIIPAMTVRRQAFEVPRTPECTSSRTRPADPCCFVKCVLDMAGMTHNGNGTFCN